MCLERKLFARNIKEPGKKNPQETDPEPLCLDYLQHAVGAHGLADETWVIFLVPHKPAEP